MKLNQITLSAFGSFAKETTIDFRKVQGGLFLISGDTGAGKTTILDGISYALFEETSGGIREGAMMRSQYADDNIPTFVELEFEYQKETYRIRRNPTYKRPSKRKNKDGTYKLTDEGANVALFLSDGTEFHGKKEEINQKIIEIIGITAKQFSSIAMIAQGKFTQMLFASSRERREIFGRLFDTEIYERVQKRLSELAGEIEEQLKGKDMLYQSYLQNLQLIPESSFEAEWNNSRTEHLSESIEEVLKQVSRICGETEQEEARKKSKWNEHKGVLEELQLQKRTATSELQWIQKRNQAEQRQKELSEKQEEMDGLRLRLKEGEQAQKLKPEYDSWQEKIKEYQKQQEEWKAAAKQLKEQEEQTRQSKERWETIEKEKNQRLQELEPMLSRLRESMEQYRQFNDLQGKTVCRKKQEEEFRQSLEQNQNEQQELKNQIQQLEQQDKRLAELAGGEAGYAKIYETMQQESEAMKELAERWSDWLKKAGEGKKKENKFRTAEHDYSEYDTSYSKALTAYLENQAGFLAKDLKENEPCPVCGSYEHPKLAVFPEDTVSQEELEHRKQKREEAEQILRSEAEEYRLWQEGIAHQLAQISQEGLRLKIPNWFTVTADIPQTAWFTGDEVKEKTKTLEEVARQRKTALLQAEKQWKQAVEAGKQRKENEAVIADLQKRLELQRETEQELQGKTQNLHEQLILLQEQVKQIRNQLLYQDEAEAKQKLEQGESEREALQHKWKEAEQCYRKAQEDMEHLRGMVVSKQQEMNRLEEDMEKKRIRFEEVWKQMDFSAISEYLEKEAYILCLDQWRIQLQQYEKALTANQIEYKTAKEQVGEKEAYSLEPLENRLKEEEAKGKELEQQWQTAVSMLHNNRRQYQQLKKLCEEYQVLAKKRNIYQTLNKTANGALTGNVKLDFQTYVQRYYFEQMIQAANRRLADMTNGKLYLQCRTMEALQIKGEAGLDLDVYSTELNQVRDVKTLSGGESFQAALAMALGMADVIQATVGRIQMDTLFIDEGFGSLDDDARRLAIEKLQAMTGTNQTVGIISHVSELREEVTHKLYVKKDQQGSHASWV